MFILAVSRSFGDAPHKAAEEEGQLIATPDVKVTIPNIRIISLHA
jgi:hypothetical protein